MDMTIKSRKTGQVFSFTRFGKTYITCNVNSQQGDIEDPELYSGTNAGTPLAYSGNSQTKFEAACRRWYRAYMRHRNA